MSSLSGLLGPIVAPKIVRLLASARSKEPTAEPMPIAPVPASVWKAAWGRRYPFPISFLKYGDRGTQKPIARGGNFHTVTVPAHLFNSPHHVIFTSKQDCILTTELTSNVSRICCESSWKRAAFRIQFQQSSCDSSTTQLQEPL